MTPYQKKTQPKAKVPNDTTKPIQLPGLHEPGYDEMPSPLPDDQKIGYAIVGLGHLSLNQIIPAIQSCKRSKLTALVSGQPKKMKRIAAMHAISETSCYSYEDFDKIRENDAVDAVFIVLPNAMHREFTLRAAEAGKHVLCEKPMAVTAEDCKVMTETCRQKGVKLMIAYRIQYEPQNTFVKKQLQSRQIGKVKLVQAQNGQTVANPDHWRLDKRLAGGGSLPDIGLYCLNTTRFILDEEPTEVFATIFSEPKDPLFREVEDSVVWQMKFPGGALAQCSSHYHSYNTSHYRVLGQEGWIEVENAYDYTGQRIRRAHDGPDGEQRDEVKIEPKNMFAQEMDYFSLCLLEDTEPYTNGYVGWQDTLIMEAIYESAEKNQPVSLKGRLFKDLKRGPEPDLDRI